LLIENNKSDETESEIGRDYPKKAKNTQMKMVFIYSHVLIES